jgi:hypothetical protein
MNVKTWWGIAGPIMLLLTACTSGSNSGGLFGCSDPAPLHGSPSMISPEFIVVFDAGVDAKAETQALAAQCGFVPSTILEGATPGFSADLTPTQLLSVRCASRVQAVYYNAVLWPL